MACAKKISEVKQKYERKEDPPFIGHLLPFVFAAYDGNIEDVQIFLLEKWMDINQKDDEYGYTALIAASWKARIDVLKLLLSQPHLKINQQKNDGWTALHIASSWGHPGCVKLLLNHSDIDVNITNNDGETPLYYASLNNKTECIKLLKAKKKEQDSF